MDSSTEIQTTTIKVALVGNPNVGKSVIFNYLTGAYVDVSNYPGTTIEITSASLRGEKRRSNPSTADWIASSDYCPPRNDGTDFKLIDTPGVYGISSFNDEERATLDYALEADIIVNVVSSITLSRDLFLTKQLADMGKPMIVALNLSDEAKLRKVEIDTQLLSHELGLSVIETIATQGKGLDILRETILASINSNTSAKQSFQIKPGKISKAIDNYLTPYIEQVLTRAEALLIAEEKSREEIYQIRHEEVDALIAKTVKREEFSKRAFFGQLLLNPIFGSIAAIAILYSFLYQFLGVFIAGTVVDWIEGGLFNNYYEPMVRSLVGSIFPILHDNIDNLILSNPLAAIGTFLAGDYGVLTLTITYLYGLLLPLVLGFYFGLAVLEDSGYLPRLAVLVDGILTRLGMNGRAIIPLILGGGCVTMAVVTTRLLTNNKEKIITMALLGLTIPCSAQLGVIQGLLSNIGGIVPWLIWGGTLALIFGLTGLAMNKLVPGDCGNFISDIPPLRIPRFNNIAKKTLLRSKVFLDEATPAFFTAAAVVAGMQVSGILESTIRFFEPIISNLLLLPKETALSFILGMVRRDFGAFGLLDIQMSAAQLVTACIVLTLFVPCIATVAVMIKEKNLKTAMAIWLASWALALGFGAILARVLNHMI